MYVYPLNFFSSGSLCVQAILFSGKHCANINITFGNVPDYLHLIDTSERVISTNSPSHTIPHAY